MAQGSMGFWSVVSVGIGGMVGGGIFAVLAAGITIGSLPTQQVVAAKEYALAAAAKPFLGQAGFSLIAIAALLSTSGELPAALEKKVWNQPIKGLLITSGLTLIIANLFYLSGREYQQWVALDFY